MISPGPYVDVRHCPVTGKLSIQLLLESKGDTWLCCLMAIGVWSRAVPSVHLCGLPA